MSHRLAHSATPGPPRARSTAGRWQHEYQTATAVLAANSSPKHIMLASRQARSALEGFTLAAVHEASHCIQASMTPTGTSATAQSTGTRNTSQTDNGFEFKYPCTRPSTVDNTALVNKASKAELRGLQASMEPLASLVRAAMPRLQVHFSQEL